MEKQYLIVTTSGSYPPNAIIWQLQEGNSALEFPWEHRSDFRIKLL